MSSGTSSTDGQARTLAMLCAVGCTGYTAPVEPMSDEVAQHLVTDRSSAFARTDDCDRCEGASSRATESRLGHVLALVHRLERHIGLVDVHLDRDHAVGELALRLEPGPLEDREHLAVLGKDLGGEPRDAVRSSDDREVLEQDRRDAAALVLVVDGERDLGLAPARPAVVARDADQVVAEQGDERHPVVVVDGREARDVVLAQPWPRAEEPVVDALVRQPSVEGDKALGVSGTHRADVDRAAIGRGRHRPPTRPGSRQCSRHRAYRDVSSPAPLQLRRLLLAPLGNRCFAHPAGALRRPVTLRSSPAPLQLRRRRFTSRRRRPRSGRACRATPGASGPRAARGSRGAAGSRTRWRRRRG